MKRLIQIFLRIGIEFFLAPGSAEIIGLPLVQAREFCGLLIDAHLADGINCHSIVPHGTGIALQAVNTF